MVTFRALLCHLLPLTECQGVCSLSSQERPLHRERAHVLHGEQLGSRGAPDSGMAVPESLSQEMFLYLEHTGCGQSNLSLLLLYLHWPVASEVFNGSYTGGKRLEMLFALALGGGQWQCHSACLWLYLVRRALLIFLKPLLSTDIDAFLGINITAALFKVHVATATAPGTH